VTKSNSVTRRRQSAEEARRKVLDVVVQTVIDIGYYKASSNEIARRAGVTWGSIQHLFGSRDQLMLDVVNFAAVRMEEVLGNAVIEGTTLEERLASTLDVLAEHYDSDVYLVQMQILMELSAQRDRSGEVARVMDRDGGAFDRLAQPLLAKAIGPVAGEIDLVYHVFMTFRGYLVTSALTRRIAALPAGALKKPMAGLDVGSEAKLRAMLVYGVAATIRHEANLRGIKLD